MSSFEKLRVSCLQSSACGAPPACYIRSIFESQAERIYPVTWTESASLPKCTCPNCTPLGGCRWGLSTDRSRSLLPVADLGCRSGGSSTSRTTEGEAGAAASKHRFSASDLNRKLAEKTTGLVSNPAARALSCELMDSRNLEHRYGLLSDAQKAGKDRSSPRLLLQYHYLPLCALSRPFLISSRWECL